MSTGIHLEKIVTRSLVRAVLRVPTSGFPGLNVNVTSHNGSPNSYPWGALQDPRGCLNPRAALNPDIYYIFLYIHT